MHPGSPGGEGGPEEAAEMPPEEQEPGGRAQPRKGRPGPAGSPGEVGRRNLRGVGSARLPPSCRPGLRERMVPTLPDPRSYFPRTAHPHPRWGLQFSREGLLDGREKCVTILSCPDLFPPPADGCFLNCQSWGRGEQDMESGLQEKGLQLWRGRHHTAKEKVSRGVRCRREASRAWPRSGRSLLSGMIDWVCPSGRRKGEAVL